MTQYLLCGVQRAQSAAGDVLIQLYSQSNAFKKYKDRTVVILQSSHSQVKSLLLLNDLWKTNQPVPRLFGTK